MVKLGWENGSEPEIKVVSDKKERKRRKGGSEGGEQGRRAKQLRALSFFGRLSRNIHEHWSRQSC